MASSVTWLARADCLLRIAPDRLLVYRVGEGWDRLCEFLEVPVPDQPFPRINDGGSMKTIWNTMTVLVRRVSWA